MPRCRNCREPFDQTRADQLYCSIHCRREYHNKKDKAECEQQEYEMAVVTHDPSTEWEHIEFVACIQDRDFPVTKDAPDFNPCGRWL